MTEPTETPAIDEAVPATRLSRRRLLQGTAVTASALSAAVVIDSLTISTAAAGSPNYPPNTVVVDTAGLYGTVKNPGPVDIPHGRQVYVEIIGGGGGGGAYWSYIGGTGTKVIGTIDSAGSWYTLNYQVGGGGGGGLTNANGSSGGAGGSGLVPGGAGGATTATGSGDNGGGGGGGGGGATAIWVGASPTYSMLLVAPGGSGSGGGSGRNGGWRKGGKRAYSPSGTLNQAGSQGRQGEGPSGSTGGGGGPTTPGTAAGGSGKANGSAGSTSAAGAGGNGNNKGPGGGGGGGGFVGGGGGAGDELHWGAAAGGSGSAVLSGTTPAFVSTPTCAAAGSENDNADVNSYTGPGHSGAGSGNNGTNGSGGGSPRGGAVNGLAGGDGSVYIKVI